MSWVRDAFDWNQARAFLVAAQEGSFSAAARKLRQTQPTLSRQVGALEEQLGVTLFERVGRGLVLTDTGRDLLEHVRSMNDAAGRVASGAAGHSQTIFGRVRISTGEAVAAYLMPPIVCALRDEYPEIEVEVVASNQLSDLRKREADIAVRHVRPAQTGLFVQKIKDSAAHLYAATSWIERHGALVEPSDVERATFVGVEDNELFLRMLSEAGLQVSAGQFKVLSESHVVVWEMLKQGAGIGGMIREIADRTPDVVRVLPERVDIPVPFWLCTHRELRTSRRIRLVYDFLLAALRAT